MTLRVHRHEITAEADVVDENGHVNNVAYVRWMQDAATLHADSVGGTAATREAGATWVVRSHHVEYLLPAFEGDRIEVYTWVGDLKRVTSRRRYRFVRVADGAELARGETEWVFVDASTGRPRSIPSSVTGTFEVVEEVEN